MQLAGSPRVQALRVSALPSSAAQPLAGFRPRLSGATPWQHSRAPRVVVHAFHEGEEEELEHVGTVPVLRMYRWRGGGSSRMMGEAAQQQQEEEEYEEMAVAESMDDLAPWEDPYWTPPPDCSANCVTCGGGCPADWGMTINFR